MAEPFDVALRVLKATLDQQMYAQVPMTEEEQQQAFAQMQQNPMGTVMDNRLAFPAGDPAGFNQEYAMAHQATDQSRTMGTMHPAIEGMLRRRGGTANVDPRQNQGNPVRITRTPQFAQDAYDLKQQGKGPADVQGQMHPTLGMQQGDLSIPFEGASGADRQMLMAPESGINPIPLDQFEFQPPPLVDPRQLRSAPANMPLEQALQSVLTPVTSVKSEPMDDAWSTLMKGKKKSKPFHGYNPNKHSKKGGLNAKGRAAAKRKTGANLKPPVTTKPSKLKPGGKKAKRRKSFCARMAGVKGPTSKKGKLTPKGASLKRWNC
jgi:hypothetical protein